LKFQETGTQKGSRFNGIFTVDVCTAISVLFASAVLAASACSAISEQHLFAQH